jgi:hypothetical protein
MPLPAAWHGLSASAAEEDEVRGMAAGTAVPTARTWNHYGQVPVRDSRGARGDTVGREKKCWDTMAESKHIPKVLVVDDEPNIRELVQVALNFHGCTVLTAASGQAALRDAETVEPDLIVLDVMLPDLDGFEVCRRLRARGNDVPIIGGGPGGPDSRRPAPRRAPGGRGGGGRNRPAAGW